MTQALDESDVEAIGGEVPFMCYRFGPSSRTSWLQDFLTLGSYKMRSKKPSNQLFPTRSE